MEYRLTLNNNIAPPPANWEGIEVELNFDTEEAEITATEFEWKGENATIINQYIADGIANGVGIFEGMPFSIEIIGTNQNLNVFDGYIDFTQDAEFSCYYAKGKLKKTAGLDFLNDRADSFRFPFLYNEGLITDADFVNIPYIVSSIPDYTNVIILSVSIYVLAVALAQQIKSLADAIDALVVGLTGIAYSILVIAANLAFLAAIMIAIYNLLKEIQENLIQSVKYHKGMYFKDMCEKACNYLDSTFSSTILQKYPYNKLVLLPKKNKKGLTTTQNKADNRGLYEGTFGDLLRALKQTFNANIRIIDKKLYLERKDYWDKLATYQVHDVNIENWAYNTDELFSNYLIEFQTDSIELNTIDEYNGTLCQETLSAKKWNNKNHILIKNLKTISIPFALSKRKNELTGIEKIWQNILKSYNKVVGGFIRFLNKFKKKKKIKEIKPFVNRIGMLKLSSDFIGVDKILIVDNKVDGKSKIAEINQNRTSARYLLDNFHFINSFYPSIEKPNGNQYKTYKDIRVPFCLNNAIELLKNNKITDINGNKGKMDKVKWSFVKDYAMISYRISEKYTDNLKQTIYEPS